MRIIILTIKNIWYQYVGLSMDTKQAMILPTISASEEVENDEEYRRGYLIDAEKHSFDSARLKIEDTKSGENRFLDVEYVSGLLGRYSKQFESEYYEKFEVGGKNPGDYPAEIIRRLLDTRTGGLTFYYHYPSSESS